MRWILPQSSFDRLSLVTWHHWSGSFLTIIFGCALCSDISRCIDPPNQTLPLFPCLCHKELRRDLFWWMVTGLLLTGVMFGFLLRICTCIRTRLVRGGALTSSFNTCPGADWSRKS